MILTCPACGTQYVVKDGAIPDGGRKVRCAACRHSWHQDPPPLELEEPLGEAGPGGADDDRVEPDPPEAAEEYPFPEEAPAPDAYEEAAVFAPPGDGSADDRPDDVDDMPDEDRLASDPDDRPSTGDWGPRSAYVPVPGEDLRELEPPREEIDDDFSPFAARGPGERKPRNPLLVVLLVILLVAALAAAFWFLAPPAWKARVGLADFGQTPLQLMMTHSDRQVVAPGNNESLSVSGGVINPTAKSQRVPPIQAELRSSTGKVVYRWTIAPPVPTLAPGASASFNSTEVNIPSGGDELTVSLGPPTS
jgi:predicted Zn finger-like uncharacterized protein